MNNVKSCSEKTKEKMAVTLKELMQTTPFDKITVSDITNACGIHRQTFYYHFQDRYELLDWLLYSELLNPFITDFNLDNMYDKFYRLFSTMYDDKRFYQSALKINSDDFTKYISEVATQDFTALINRIARESGVASGDSSTALLMAEFLGHGISGIIKTWTEKGMKEAPSVMTERLQLIINSTKRLIISEF